MTKHILVVDDNAASRARIQEVLTVAGMSVVVAENGMQALLIAKSERLDGVVTDQVMPMMDGCHLCQMLREIPAYRQIPIVLLTTEAGPAFQEEMEACGVPVWLEKPLTEQKLALIATEMLHPSVATKTKAA
ncbi:response regulator [Ferrimonas sediminicola]|uniref:Response regulator n=1 Tax=Ferrimonas sediminicola TaxID=2569538 RepID=A0A4V5NV50_9GAMM|nr:response regulator [Ferrimonas sediminicola]TKB49064.1 response regulator [Ferrimonas sediminicola]